MARSQTKTNALHKQQRRPLVRWSGEELPPVMTRTSSVRRIEERRLIIQARRGRAELWQNLLPKLGLLAFGLAVALALFVSLRFAWQQFQHWTDRDVQLIALSQAAEGELPELKRQNSATLMHRVRRGDTLGGILTRVGVGGGEVDALAKALEEFSKKEDRVTLLKPGAELELEVDSAGLVGLRKQLDLGSTLVVARAAHGRFSVKLSELPRAREEVVAVGTVQSSFAAAAAASGVPYDVVDDFVDLFGDRVVFHQDFQRGDRFVLIFESQTLPDGSRLQAGPILAASLQLGQKKLIALRYVGTDGKARYFNEKGELLGNTFLRYPLKFTRISSYYSHSRMHPILKIRRPHEGVDFAAPIGTPIRSVADGVVTFAARKGGAGILIKVKHNSRYQTGYLHLSRIDPSVRVGRRVSRGQVIGYVGQSGHATGPHLDYRIWDNNRTVDPLKVKLPMADELSRGMRVDRRYLQRALYTLEHYGRSEFWSAKTPG